MKSGEQVSMTEQAIRDKGRRPQLRAFTLWRRIFRLFSCSLIVTRGDAHLYTQTKTVESNILLDPGKCP
jgi:hypothetical protein